MQRGYSNLNCQVDRHYNNPIVGVCTNKECQNKRPFCVVCQFQFHNDHLNDLKTFDELNNWLCQNSQIVEKLKNQLNELNKFVKTISNLIQSNQYDFQQMNLTELHNIIDKQFTLWNDQNKMHKHLSIILSTISSYQQNSNSINQLDQKQQFNQFSQKDQNQELMPQLQSYNQIPQLQIISPIRNLKLEGANNVFFQQNYQTNPLFQYNLKEYNQYLNFNFANIYNQGFQGQRTKSPIQNQNIMLQNQKFQRQRTISPIQNQNIITQSQKFKISLTKLSIQNQNIFQKTQGQECNQKQTPRGKSAGQFNNLIGR